MSMPISTGYWAYIENEEQYDNLKDYDYSIKETYYNSEISIGWYSGPGMYYVINTYKKCYKKCCHEREVKILSNKELIEECKIEITKITDILRIAINKSK